MCGICGLLNFDKKPVDGQLLRNICRGMRHRGPDGEGYYENTFVGLGHRRLAIIDLKTGDQPIPNETRELWLIANGAIYNYRELRRDLTARGHRFSGGSDSEVIVHLYEEYGEECFRFLRGMFAFAIWDERQQRLFLARDRFGQKPLFYLRQDRFFAFASEIGPLLKIPEFSARIDPCGLDMYLSYQYVPPPRTIIAGVNKLPAANFLFQYASGESKQQRYWQLEFETQSREGINQYSEGVRARLEEAVKLRMVSDVPVGAFLSGGLDSSFIVALMSRHSTLPVNTFSAAFSQKSYDESGFSRAVAGRFQTRHQELKVEPEGPEAIRGLISLFGEPFADYSVVPTCYLSRFAAQHVKVALNGDGGDENFAGYSRYQAVRAASVLDLLPAFIRKGITLAGAFIPEGDNLNDARWRIRRFFRYLPLEPRRRYFEWISTFGTEEKARLYEPEFGRTLPPEAAFSWMEGLYERALCPDLTENTLRVDMESYLPNDLLVKMDTAGMANSLEARSPFLDHEFVEYCAKIPFQLKLKFFAKKHILKQAATGILPGDILNRRKQGFGAPAADWFRNKWQEFVVDVLLADGCRLHDFIRQEEIRMIIERNTEGVTDNGYKLWSLLVLELWLREFIP